MIMPRDRHAGRIHNIKIHNKFIEMMEHFTYVGTNLKKPDSVREEMKSSLNEVKGRLLSFDAVFFLPVCYLKM